MELQRGGIKRGGKAAGGILIDIGLLVLGCFLFAGSFPNPLVINGIPILAWFAFIPIFLLLMRIPLWASPIYGGVYGYLSFTLFNYWLGAFHPLAGIIVGLIYFVWNLISFFAMSLALKFFPKKGYLILPFIWLAYEYLRIQGFLGYPYGIIGYSQWEFLPLIQVASVFGVWAVSLLVVFPQAVIAHLIKAHAEARRRGGMETIGIKTPAFPAAPREIIIWAVLFVVSLVYGLISINHYNKLQTDAPDTAKIALVQPNLDPWRGGLPAYKANYAALKRLSDEAIASSEAANENAGLDLVVWPETAFVPRIYWHTHYRDDPPSYALVKELLDYLASQDVPFLLGNDDARREVQPNGQYERVDYNAALLFEKGEEKGIYRKMRLVPFTEHFPYKDILPGVYQILLDADTHMWKAGVDPTVFKVDKFNFSTPICFEDCFGYISREFVQNGADILVNITNDAWSQSLSAQMQHATMAAFRAVENRKPIVRSTASGQTCAFSPTGKLLAMAEPFCETFLLVDLPILRGEGSLYTEAGDILGLLAAIFSLGILLFGGISCIIKKRMKK